MTMLLDDLQVRNCRCARASLVVVAATCMFDIPIEGIALILPIDHFCDMFRSATNVLGNALATRW
jgi:Na+/H+-dicarboxylate symporter